MVPFRRPRLPDRQAILHIISVLQPKAGRISGALSGMILAGPAWLYGLCVGLLLGYMVDTLRVTATTGSAETGKESATGEFTGESPKDNEASDDGTGHSTITKAEDEPDPYQPLGLLPGASMAEVKKAWRTLSRQAHPDAPSGAAEDFMALKTAYEKILELKKSDPPGN